MVEIHFIGRSSEISEAEEMVNNLYSSFEYSTTSRGNYREELLDKEPDTENLEAQLEEAQSYIS